jgi:hypothetical protein
MCVGDFVTLEVEIHTHTSVRPAFMCIPPIPRTSAHCPATTCRYLHSSAFYLIPGVPIIVLFALLFLISAPLGKCS